MNSKIKPRKGFTLIELLVVIAIIGILSAVVLANLNSARLRGNDTSTKATLKNLLTQAAIYYDSNGSNYGNGLAAIAGTPVPCPTSGSSMWGSPVIANMVSSIMATANTSGQVLCATDATTGGTTQNWRMEVPTNVTQAAVAIRWCIDSTGQNKQAPIPSIMVVTATNVSLICP
jgi:prepilin-type N-terminal cleavage/methylation domain-containing protein